MFNVLVGNGFSANGDPKKAAREAGKKALRGLKGKKPTISYVFFAGDYDPQKISDGLKETLGKTEFIGGTADAVFFEDKIERTGVVVASVYSEYLHVGISSIEGISKDPKGLSKKVTSEALSKISIDKYIDPYLQFTRMRSGNVKWMVKKPSFYITVFAKGMKLPQMGEETKIIQGITEEVGFNVPIWGGSMGVHLEKLFEQKPYEIYLLHSGKVLKDGLIIAVNSTSLMYGESLVHGTERTNKIGFISGVTGGGYIITGISGKNPVEWYCEQLGIKKEEFVKKSLVLTQQHPLGIPDNYGGYIIRAGGVPAGENLAFTVTFEEGWPVYIMESTPKSMATAPQKVVEDLYKNTNENKPALALAIICASCRVVEGEKGVTQNLKDLKKNLGGAPLIGFSSFTEIGSKEGVPTTVQHEATTLLTLYDKLLHQVKN
ncbi:MAG: FIST N-terminal domain-containing protein [Candidatus Norongarragalinales archaeon]